MPRGGKVKGVWQDAELDGIRIEIVLNSKPKMSPYRLFADRPGPRRAIRYVESRTGESFGINYGFLPPIRENHDPSISFRIETRFEDELVCTKKVSGDSVRAGDGGTLNKVTRGEHKGGLFHFYQVKPPDDPDEEELYDSTNQGTIFVDFFRLKARAVECNRRSRWWRDQPEFRLSRKELLKDPMKKLSHRPGVLPKAAEPNLSNPRPADMRYDPLDDPQVPYYSFELRLRSVELLREMGLPAVREEPWAERYARQYQTNRAIEQTSFKKDETADDELVFLFSKTKENINTDNETSKKPQTQDNVQASGSEKKVPKMSGARHAANMKQERVPQKLNGQAEVTKYRESFRKFADSRRGSTRMGSALNGANDQDSPMFVPKSTTERNVQPNNLGNRNNPVEISSQGEAGASDLVIVDENLGIGRSSSEASKDEPEESPEPVGGAGGGVDEDGAAPLTADDLLNRYEEGVNSRKARTNNWVMNFEEASQETGSVRDADDFGDAVRSMDPDGFARQFAVNQNLDQAEEEDAETNGDGDAADGATQNQDQSWGIKKKRSAKRPIQARRKRRRNDDNSELG